MSAAKKVMVFKHPDGIGSELAARRELELCRSENEKDPEGNILESTRKIFVGGLAWSTTAETLSAYFSKFGPVVNAYIIMDTEEDKSRGFGFVEFEDPSSVMRVLEQSHFRIDGRSVECKPSYSRDRATSYDDRRVKVSGLPSDCQQKCIINAFARFGKIEHVKFDYESDGGCVAYITYSGKSGINSCLEVGTWTYNGKPITVSKTSNKSALEATSPCLFSKRGKAREITSISILPMPSSNTPVASSPSTPVSPKNVSISPVKNTSDRKTSSKEHRVSPKTHNKGQGKSKRGDSSPIRVTHIGSCASDGSRKYTSVNYTDCNNCKVVSSSSSPISMASKISSSPFGIRTNSDDNNPLIAAHKREKGSFKLSPQSSNCSTETSKWKEVLNANKGINMGPTFVKPSASATKNSIFHTIASQVQCETKDKDTRKVKSCSDTFDARYSPGISSLDTVKSKSQNCIKFPKILGHQVVELNGISQKASSFNSRGKVSPLMALQNEDHESSSDSTSGICNIFLCSENNKEHATSTIRSGHGVFWNLAPVVAHEDASNIQLKPQLFGATSPASNSSAHERAARMLDFLEPESPRMPSRLPLFTEYDDPLRGVTGIYCDDGADVSSNEPTSESSRCKACKAGLDWDIGEGRPNIFKSLMDRHGASDPPSTKNIFMLHSLDNTKPASTPVTSEEPSTLTVEVPGSSISSSNIEKDSPTCGVSSETSSSSHRLRREQDDHYFMPSITFDEDEEDNDDEEEERRSSQRPSSVGPVSPCSREALSPVAAPAYHSFGLFDCESRLPSSACLARSAAEADEAPQQDDDIFDASFSDLGAERELVGVPGGCYIPPGGSQSDRACDDYLGNMQSIFEQTLFTLAEPAGAVSRQ